MKPKYPIIIMDFTGAYQNESFYQKWDTHWIDCRHLEGVFGYCDTTSSEFIKKKIQPYGPHGIHFIDSGNFHYVTKLWTDYITSPFSLCVFDHHTDMQPSLFDTLLSCGNWIKTALDENPYLNKVLLIGVDQKLLKTVPDAYKNRLIPYSTEKLSTPEGFKSFSSITFSHPLYLSIDKDVLNTKSAQTDWDQGTLSLTLLKKILFFLEKHAPLIGVDICGECSSTIHTDEFLIAEAINSLSNEAILNCLLKASSFAH